MPAKAELKKDDAGGRTLCQDTFGRVLSLIEPREFERCLLRWVNQQVNLGAGEVISIDGKTLKRSHDKSKGQAAIEIVSARKASQRLKLRSVKVAAVSNEIPRCRKCSNC